MVAGLERFRDHFQAHDHQYALIGGAACDLAMERLGLTFRATKDLDIVLLVEELDAAFGRAFWEFIRAGGYQTTQSSGGTPRLYRFARPEVAGYPMMLEVFSAKPHQVALGDEPHFTPIPFDEAASSLSAILLNDEYYGFLKRGVTVIDGIPIVGPEYLIPLKARAWLDLAARKASGESVDSKVIRKHRNDVFRLYGIIDPTPRGDLPELVRGDMRRFLDEVAYESIDLRSLGITGASLAEVIEQLGRIYGTS